MGISDGERRISSIVFKVFTDILVVIYFIDFLRSNYIDNNRLVHTHRLIVVVHIVH